MFNRRISTFALAAFLSIGVIAVAQDGFTPPSSPEEAVAMRKALMREDGGILRSAARLTGAEAIAAIETLHANYSHIPALFPEGSLVGDSEALPAIWENWDAFVAIAKAGEDAAASGLAAAQAGDTAGYTAALRTIQGTCGQCHQQFRR